MTGATSLAYDGGALGHAAGRSSGQAAPLLPDDDESLVHAAVDTSSARSASDAATANANASNNTGHLTFTNNRLSTSNPNPGLGGPANVVSGNVSISGATLPAEAQAVASAAGLESGYADLKTSP